MGARTGFRIGLVEMHVSSTKVARQSTVSRILPLGPSCLEEFLRFLDGLVQLYIVVSLNLQKMSYEDDR